uniref:Uncharacterized protein n=1 Tax=Steinernema glaseri TaxID=37863 RepID=A0A1I8AUX4_9BILA
MPLCGKKTGMLTSQSIEPLQTFLVRNEAAYPRHETIGRKFGMKKEYAEVFNLNEAMGNLKKKNERIKQKKNKQK